MTPHGLKPTRLLCPWNSTGKNIGVACHSQPRDWTRVSCIAECLPLESPVKPLSRLLTCIISFSLTNLWKSVLNSHYRYSDTDREDITFLRLTLMDLTFHSIQRGYVSEILRVCWGGSGQRSPWEQGVAHKWMQNEKFHSSWLGREQKCQIHKAN